MTPNQKKQLHNEIVQTIEQLKKEIATLQRESEPIAPDCSMGNLIREELIIKQSVSIKTLKEYSLRVQKLQFTLENIENEAYGICQECDEEIRFERLLLLPESIYCVSCQNELNT